MDQLAGVSLPLSAWESQVLPARLPEVTPDLLDAAFASGELVWTGHGRLGADDGWIRLHLADALPLGLDADELEPFVTWGTNPGQGLPLSAAVPAPEDFVDETDRYAAERALSRLKSRKIATCEAPVLFESSLAAGLLGACSDTTAASAPEAAGTAYDLSPAQSQRVRAAKVDAIAAKVPAAIRDRGTLIATGAAGWASRSSWSKPSR